MTGKPSDSAMSRSRRPSSTTTFSSFVGTSTVPSIVVTVRVCEVEDAVCSVPPQPLMRMVSAAAAAARVSREI